MEVISRANIYKKIELAKELLKNVASCQDTVAVLDNVQSALEEETVFNMDDEEAQNYLVVKKCSCGGTLEIRNVRMYDFGSSFGVLFACDKCNKPYIARKGTKLEELVNKWNSEYANEEVDNE